MKYWISIPICILMLIYCQTENELTVAQKIANAHGFENWKDVSQVNFTFRVDTDNIEGKERIWSWFPKKDSISMQTSGKSFNYKRSDLSHATVVADRAFINDKFWAFIPFQLVWDKNLTISEPVKIKAPVSNVEMNMITVLYPEEGGYTPGDAYDLFYTDDFIIQEWQFRKGNTETAMLTNTFENYGDYSGLKIANDHKKADENWNLLTTNISIIKN